MYIIYDNWLNKSTAFLNLLSFGKNIRWYETENYTKKHILSIYLKTYIIYVFGFCAKIVLISKLLFQFKFQIDFLCTLVVDHIQAIMN